MTNKLKLQKVLAAMSNHNSGLGAAFKSVEAEMERVADLIRQEAEIRTVEDSKKRIAELKLEVASAVGSLIQAFENLKGALGANEIELTKTLNIKLDALRGAMSEFRTAQNDRFKVVANDIGVLRADIKDIGDRKVKIPDFAKDISKLELELGNLIRNLKDDSEDQLKGQSKDLKKQIDNLEEDFKKLRSSMSNLASNRGHGGQANRNILVSNNPSTLSQYTDLNIKAGANITLSYTSNNNLKTTDLTIAATGGVGSGITRNIATVSTSQVLAAVASTDYVVIASAGVGVTLPTAVGNSNLYTIKNVAASSVMVLADGVETIDGSANIILNTQFTSIDLISDNSNWQIT